MTIVYNDLVIRISKSTRNNDSDHVKEISGLENLFKNTITALTSFVIKETDLDKNVEESSILTEKIQAPSDLYDNKTTFQFYSKSSFP